MPIKSFRGLIADGAIEIINLHTNTGAIGYKIVNFQIMGNTPGNASTGSYEHLLKIYSVPQTTATAIVDFSDQTLIAAGLNFAQTSPQFDGNKVIIFDNVIFNQDIYITHVDVDSARPANYHIELEKVKLDLNENTVATLRDIRNIVSQWVNNII